MKVIACALLLLAATVGEARSQDRGKSLTEDFGHMSARERSRVAREEQQAAQNDPAYQEAMRQAEEMFQQKRYEDALARYQEARNLRPLNVYPKVKIQDMEALIKQQAEQVEKQKAAEEKPPVPLVKEEPFPLTSSEVQEVVAEPPPPAPVITKPRPEAPKAPVKKEERPSTPPVTRQEEVVRTPGMTETRYREGNAEVIERRIVADGREMVFKKVSHAWGGIFYFQDGQAVDERVWKARFGDR